MAGCGEGATASVGSNGGGNKNEDESRRSSIISCAGGSHATSGGRSGGTNTHTTSPMSGTNGPTTRTAANGMKRKLRSVTRAASASREVFCHILPTKKPRRGFDGKFIRPIGRPPVEGFVWDPVGGYWIPRGVAGLSPPKKNDTTHSNAAGGDDQQSISSHSSTTSSTSSSSSSSSSSSCSTDDNDSNNYRNGNPNIRVQLCDSTPSTWNQQQMKQQQKVASTKQKGIADIGKYHSTSTNAISSAPARLTHNRSRKLSKATHKLSSSTETLHSMQSSSGRHDVKYHIGSMWKEPCPIDGTVLTLYERHRKPRPVPTGKHYCSIKALQQEFRCVICLGYIRNARVVKECLHRFCEVCIEKALIQFGKRNECPICRVYIPTRRSLAPDPNFDRLIQCILKDIAFEEDDDDITNNNNSKNNNNNNNKNTTSGTAMTAENTAARQAAESRARALQESIRKKRLVAVPTTTTTQNTNTTDTTTMVCEIIHDNANPATTTTTTVDDTTIIPEPCQQQQQHQKNSEESNSNSDDIVIKSPQQQSSLLQVPVIVGKDNDTPSSTTGIENDSMKMPPPAPLSLVGNQSLDTQQQPSQQRQRQQTGTIAMSPMSPPDRIVKIVLLPYDNSSDEDRKHNISNNGTETYNTLPQLQQPFLTISSAVPVKILRRFLEIKLCCPRLQICSTIVVSDTKNNNIHNNNNNNNNPQNFGIDDSANRTTNASTTIGTMNSNSTTISRSSSTKVVTYRDSKTIEEIATYAGRESTKRRNSCKVSTTTTTATTMNNSSTTVDDIGDYIPIYYRLAPTTTLTTTTTVAAAPHKTFSVSSTGPGSSSGFKKKTKSS